MSECRTSKVETKACPYSDVSGHAFNITAEIDDKRGLMININGYSLWFEADKWPELRAAVDEALRPFAAPEHIGR